MVAAPAAESDASKRALEFAAGLPFGRPKS